MTATGTRTRRPRRVVAPGGRSGRQTVLATTVVLFVNLALSILLYAWEVLNELRAGDRLEGDSILALIGTLWLVPMGIVAVRAFNLYRDTSVEVGEMRAELHERRGQQLHDARSLGQSRIEVREIIEGQQIVPHYQPIVRMGEDPALIGFEALSRFPHGTPDRWFGMAARVGLTVDLELEAIRRALERPPAGHPSAYLSVNVSPLSVAASDMAALFRDIGPEHMVIELTEHLVVQDYDTVNEALRRLRDIGVRVAVDDAGAGFASFRHIVNLRPDYIKLDRSLTHGLDRDEARYALASAITTFSKEVGAVVVAEGVETAEEMDALLRIGVDYGQGYLFGRPAPAGSWQATPWGGPS